MYGNVARRRKNLDNIVRQAKDYDSRCLLLGLGSSLNNFIVFLDSCEEVDEKAEKVTGAVNVITYHKSKGLEWNIVILESLDYDELDDNALIRKTFFGVNDIIVTKPSAANLFPERYIQVLPWFAGTKRNLPDDIKNDILVNKVFGFLRDKTSEEVKRLMYVGVTRARDFLITTSYNNCELSWLTNIGCNPVIPDDHTSPTIDIWSVALQVASQRIDPIDETDEVEITEDLTIWVHPEKSLNYRHPRYLNPSKTFEELNIEVLLLESFNQRITIRNDNNDGEKFTDDQVGTALHNIFCIFQPDNRELTGKINTLLATGHMLSVFPHPDEIIRSAKNLYDFLNNTWPSCQKIYKELPVQQRTEEGQIIRGSCDLVWETDAGFVLVDYKSYPGPLPSVLNLGLHYAGNYARQLNTYKRVLEKTGKPVLATLIYYLVSGNIVEIKTSKLLPQQNIIESSADPDNIVCWEEYENLSTLGWISTGIENVIIYVGPHPNGSYRLRVSNIPNKHAREDCFTITIPDLAIVGTVNKSFITDEIMGKIKEFVLLNIDAIKTYSDWDITTNKFLDLLKPVGSQ